MFRRNVLAKAEENHVAGGESGVRTLHKVATRRLEQRLVAAGLCPIRRIGAGTFRLRPDQIAPKTAQQPETIATDTAERALVTIRRADPAARLRDDCRTRDRHEENKLPPSKIGSLLFG